MDWLERAIESIAPQWALQRAQTRHRLEAYRLASDSTLRRLVKDRGGPHVQTERAGAKLRDWGRHLARNNPTIQAICRELALRTSHHQLVPMVRTRSGDLATDVNEQISEQWREFRDALDLSGQLTYGQLRQIIGHSYVRDGEVYPQLILGSRRITYQSDIPLALQVLESDYLPWDLTQTSPTIVQGVELTAAGRAAAYHFYREHPGEAGATRYRPTAETIRIAADRVLALIHVERAGQVRGLSMLAPSGETAADIDEYLEAERIAMKMAAAIGLQIVRSPDMGAPVLNTDGQRQIDFEPGMVLDSLRPGERAEMLAHDRPTSQFAEYLKQAYRGMAAGVGANYSAVTNDFDGSYSSQRQMLVTVEAWHTHLQALQQSRIDRPLHRAFIQALVLAGRLPTSRQVDPATIMEAQFVPPAMPWIDPQKEVDAAVAKIDAGLSSRQTEIRKAGEDITRIDREIAADGFERAASDAGGSSAAMR